jgi:D-alanine--poly(phosphoribitol) ligase subunit 2
MEDILTWVTKWFEKRGGIPGNSLEEKLAVNYFNSGLIDSLGVIEMITEMEKHFRIRFTEMHFQDRRFSTIGGLGEIIRNLSRQTKGEID